MFDLREDDFWVRFSVFVYQICTCPDLNIRHSQNGAPRGKVSLLLDHQPQIVGYLGAR